MPQAIGPEERGLDWLVDLFGSAEALAAACDVEPVTVRVWRFRHGYVPPDHWSRVVASARSHEVTLEWLQALYERRRRAARAGRRPRPRSAA